MAIKKIRMRPEGTNDYVDVLHPETTASQVIEEVNKKFMTDAERSKLSGIEDGANNYIHPAGTNPHGTTKSDVYLGNVLNYGVATKAEAEAGTSNTKYMTPLRVKDAISSLTPPSASAKMLFYTGNTSVSNGGRASVVIPLGVTPTRYIKYKYGQQQTSNTTNGYFNEGYIDMATKRFVHWQYTTHKPNNTGSNSDSWGSVISGLMSSMDVGSSHTVIVPYDCVIVSMAISGTNLVMVVDNDGSLNRTISLTNLILEVC